MTDLDYHTAARFLKADFETGKLFWLPRALDLFQTENHCDAWNAGRACEEALRTLGSKGYLHGTVLGRRYRAHRVVWLLATGSWPADQIDHINGVRTDNRLVNLREATGAENNRNARIPRHNTSGVMGVAWCGRERKWRARIKSGGAFDNLGRFPQHRRRDRRAQSRRERVRFSRKPRTPLKTSCQSQRTVIYIQSTEANAVWTTGSERLRTTCRSGQAWVASSIGRALALQARGCRFKSDAIHQIADSGPVKFGPRTKPRSI